MAAIDKLRLIGTGLERYKEELKKTPEIPHLIILLTFAINCHCYYLNDHYSKNVTNHKFES